MAAAIGTRPARTGRLRRSCPATIPMPTRTANAPRSARPVAAAGTWPISALRRTAIQAGASRVIGAPRIGRRPIRFGTSVGTKPPPCRRTCHATRIEQTRMGNRSRPDPNPQGIGRTGPEQCRPHSRRIPFDMPGPTIPFLARTPRQARPGAARISDGTRRRT